VGVTVTGLAGTGLVLRNNGADNLSITGNTSFTFATRVASGGAYAVTVLTPPSSPSQTCTPTSGGTVGGANVVVAVTCVTNTYTVGGTISGLTSSGLVLQNNGGDDLVVLAAATSFTFVTPVASGASYAVSVRTQPSSPTVQNCTVTSGGGNVGSGNVASVLLSCL
jgi:hypothetical protein